MNTLQLFSADTQTLYPIDVAARLAGVPRHQILVYYKHGLLAPLIDEAGGYYFSEESIRSLQRIEYLRVARGVNLPGIKLALDLLQEVERLEEEIRTARR